MVRVLAEEGEEEIRFTHLERQANLADGKISFLFQNRRWISCDVVLEGRSHSCVSSCESLSGSC